MTLMLDLPHELERELVAEAGRLNLPLSEYILRVLLIGRPDIIRLKTGAELVDYWQQEGVIGTRPDIADSAEHARTLRNQVERREQS